MAIQTNTNPRAFGRGIQTIKYPQEKTIQRFITKDYVGEMTLSNETGLWEFSPMISQDSIYELESDLVAINGRLVSLESKEIPTGGTAGQVLAKIDGTDFNTEWIDQADSSTDPDVVHVNVADEFSVLSSNALSMRKDDEVIIEEGVANTKKKLEIGTLSSVSSIFANGIFPGGDTNSVPPIGYTSINISGNLSAGTLTFPNPAYDVSNTSTSFKSKLNLYTSAASTQDCDVTFTGVDEFIGFTSPYTVPSGGSQHYFEYEILQNEAGSRKTVCRLLNVDAGGSADLGNYSFSGNSIQFDSPTSGIETVIFTSGVTADTTITIGNDASTIQLLPSGGKSILLDADYSPRMPSTSIADIDASTDKALTTKEWVLAKTTASTIKPVWTGRVDAAGTVLWEGGDHAVTVARTGTGIYELNHTLGTNCTVQVTTNSGAFTTLATAATASNKFTINISTLGDVNTDYGFHATIFA